MIVNEKIRLLLGDNVPFSFGDERNGSFGRVYTSVGFPVNKYVFSSKFNETIAIR